MEVADPLSMRDHKDLFSTKKNHGGPLLETSVGDLVIDLDLEGSSVMCRNFLKLCKRRDK